MPKSTKIISFSRGELVRLRERAGLSRYALAARAGLSRQALGDLEAGERTDPSWSTVQALADALGVPTEAFRLLPPPEKIPKKNVSSA